MTLTFIFYYSWGTVCGEAGFLYMKSGVKYDCGIFQSASYPIM